MVGNHLQQHSSLCRTYEFDASLLQQTQRTMQVRRRRRLRNLAREPYTPQPDNSSVTSAAQGRPTIIPFFELIQHQGHRFVCFFVVQYTNAIHYSHHSLSIRKLLALDYGDFVTTVVIMVGRSAETEDGVDPETDSLLQIATEERNSSRDLEHASAPNFRQSELRSNGYLWDLFCLGTGFSLLPDDNTSFLLSILNVIQVPSIIVVDTATGRKVGGDATLLAMETHRDNPQQVLQAWEQGKSGLSFCETLLALAKCQTLACMIQ
jgi:hypothetical protein